MNVPVAVEKRFDAVCQALSDPSFYPHPVASVERRDTHISAVFLTGRWVYKLKKAVDFGFLNFMRLEDRRQFCEQEVRLNSRFSRDIYDGVVPIYQHADGRITLEDTGTVVEYAVRMRQLPDAASLRAMLDENKMTEARLTELGAMLVEFHQRSERNETIDHYGGLDVVSFNIEENFTQMEPFRDNIPDVRQWDFICRATREFLDHHRTMFENRVAGGHIRDGHGDLRAEHVYVYEGIQIIDCIEFNERFRYGDTVLDLAFLHMDMECLGYPDAARTLMAAYAARADDPQLYALLDFYAAYRAVVRLKVSCFQLSDADAARRLLLEKDIEKYFRLAYRYTLQFSRPTVWVFCGLPATGKSMLAEHLAQTLSIPLLQSDTLRKEDQRHPSSNVVPFGSGIYRKEARDEVYARMRERAGKWLQKGDSVILDATYAHRSWRLEISRLAVSLNTNCIFVECICDPQVIRLRLMAREKAEGLSDARLEHLPKMIESFEPLSEQPVECRMQIDTDRDFQNVFYQLLVDGHYRRNEQVKRDL